MIIKKYSVKDKSADLFITDKPDMPLVVLNGEKDENRKIVSMLEEDIGDRANYLCVGGLDWNRDLSPWEAAPAFKKGEAFFGGADEYLQILISDIIPKAEEFIKGTPVFAAIAGYSLAGLFALYALYRCDRFSRAASVSGSLWFPGFTEFAKSGSFIRTPDKLYLSLGDAEANTRNPRMCTVLERTEEMAEYYRGLGIETCFELNPGNHFKDPEERCVKGIRALIP